MSEQNREIVAINEDTIKNKIYYISNIFYGILLFSIGLTSKVFIFSSLMSITLITLSIIGLLKTKNKKSWLRFQLVLFLF